MASSVERFLRVHDHLTRRFFLGLGASGAAALAARTSLGDSPQRDPQVQAAIDRLETWLTDQDQFQDVSRGDPKPHSLPEETRKAVGLTRDTWRLEVIGDPDHKPRLGQTLTKQEGTALDFAGLMKLAETHAVRFPKVMTCLNIGCPLGTGIWEGVPLRDVLWMAEPLADLRRVFYHGYHNDDPAQLFQSSLPVGRVLEDPFDLPPVILCYKLNGQWLSPERGGPVRIVVPEAYGFKSIKWLQTLVLSNIPHANDTYAEKNNDVDSPLKTFAATIDAPTEVKANEPIALTGYAQVGVSGLSKVQVWIHDDSQETPQGDRYFSQAPWKDAEILPPPVSWGGGLPDDAIPHDTMQFDPATGQPEKWPLLLAKVHWAVLHRGLPEGEYSLRCRTIDAGGHAQPMPRPFQKSGHAAIERISFRVKA